jgi:hypothetical protein
MNNLAGTLWVGCPLGVGAALNFPLVRAVLGLPDDRLACDECQVWLPGYVNAEMAGLSDDPRYHAVKRHLLLCPSCESDYLALMDLALAEEEGRFA